MVLPALVFMDKNVTEHFTYATWKLFRWESVIPQFFPPKIDAIYRSMSLGVFEKIKPKLQGLMKTR